MTPAGLGRLGRRAAALALLGLLLLLAKAAVVDPIVDARRRSQEALADAANLLARVKSVAATKPKLEELVQRLEQDVSHSDAFLRAETEALAGAGLQQRLRALAAAQGIALGEVQWSADKAENGLGRVSLRVQIATSIAPLYALLGAIETSTPLLFVDDIDIQGSSEAQTVEPDQPVPLTVSFDCFGYWLPPNGSAAKVAP